MIGRWKSVPAGTYLRGLIVRAGQSIPPVWRDGEDGRPSFNGLY